jgi:hypothetical protein
MAISNLAVTMAFQGKYEAAERENRKALELRKETQGPEHPDTTTSMANLAATIWNQGCKEEAEELDSQFIEIRKRVFGPEHADIPASKLLGRSPCHLRWLSMAPDTTSSEENDQYWDY